MITKKEIAANLVEEYVEYLAQDAEYVDVEVAATINDFVPVWLSTMGAAEQDALLEGAASLDEAIAEVLTIANEILANPM